ncbi:hypothetical protein BN381_350059 [Candidatus Microthrix parvicella RN1]|uniref:Uncharacterized protein n=1 Tax=Candidatus Neomicrothrix parvicella RN1 TaxID=1229780 RepID=R4YZX4_9ACTN|nr:hypothetical protein BN381_350059 [Candidatus Microthrix parvicella RN1]
MKCLVGVHHGGHLVGIHQGGQLVAGLVLPQHPDAHRAGGAGHLLLGLLQVVGVQVGHLGGGDLGQLGLGDLAHGATSRQLRALLQPGCRTDEHRRGRCLQNERERTILVDGDLDGHDGAALVLSLGVVGLREIHDGDAVGAQGGTNGGRRGCLTGRDLDLDDGRDLFLCHDVLSRVGLTTVCDSTGMGVDLRPVGVRGDVGTNNQCVLQTAHTAR